MAVYWVVAPCSLVEVYQRFRGPCCLHHQGDVIVIAYNRLKTGVQPTPEMSYFLKIPQTMGNVQDYYCVMCIQHKQTHDLRDARACLYRDENTGINIIGTNRRDFNCSCYTKAVLPLRRRDCDSIKKKVDYT
jgi:hypothetical protein